jgi:hypothetical protein
MWHGDRAFRDNSDLESSRFNLAAEAFRGIGIEPKAVIYNDEFRDEVKEQLVGLDAVQVWVNPIESGRDRSVLDVLLREVADAGVLVFTHPDTILKMGTKQVLIDTRKLPFGSGCFAYESIDEMRLKLPDRLTLGPRILKQYRGHSGGGIWKFCLAEPFSASASRKTNIRLRHAARGSVEEIVTFDQAVERMVPYFESFGRMIDQPYQERLVDGITRIYMVEERVGGFGFQAINALYPAPPGEDTKDAPQPGPRLYYAIDEPEFQTIRHLMESDWVHQLRDCFEIKTKDLPLLWDADFLFGPKDQNGKDTYVLCEINVSCVSPYPRWANSLMAETALRRLNNQDGDSAQNS